MLSLLALLEAEGPSDAVGVGLVLASVGGFLLANSIVFRHPRTLLAEFFGEKRGKLTSIRGYIFHRLQIHLGFLFLLIGFGLQVFGHYHGTNTSFPVSWVGAVLFAVVALEVSGWWLSHALFRRYVREYFHEHPPNLESDMALLRELGELFGIPATGDDTVQSYLQRVRSKLGVSGARRPEVPTPSVETSEFRGMGPEEGLV